MAMPAAQSFAPSFITSQRIVATNDMPFGDQSELQVGSSVYDRWSGATRQRPGADMVF
jgi:hypothetical protein